MFFPVFKTWKKSIETENALKLSNLQIDGGGEYVSLALKRFCEEEGIVMEFTLPYILEQNLIAK